MSGNIVDVLALAVIGVAIFFGWRAARKGPAGSKGLDLSSPAVSVGLVVAVCALLFAVFSTLRGVLWNNLWWVVAVTGLATIIGLLLAVLADRSKSENAAKTLIFMPMAISMVGAAVIWSFRSRAAVGRPTSNVCPSRAAVRAKSTGRRLSGSVSVNRQSSQPL